MELETVPSASQYASLHEAIGGMRSLVRATRVLEENARLSVEEMVHDLSRETIALAEQVRDGLHGFFRLEDELQTDERIDYALVIAGLVANALENLAATAESSLTSNWLAEDMKKVRGIAEEYRDIEETLALGRSRSFQKELQDAKQEARK